MELIKHSEIQSLEDYKLYKKQQFKIWYKKNREKKIKYQMDRYYNSKKPNQAE